MKNKFLLSMMTALTIALLSSCAQYKVSTDHVNDYQGHIEKLSVWSSIGRVGMLSHKARLESDTFSNRFDTAIVQAFQNEKISAIIHDIPAQGVKVDYNAAEQEFHPNTRLIVQPNRFQTSTSTGNFGTSQMLTRLWLDLSLIDLGSGRAVWHGSIFVDNSGIDPTVWKTGGAEKLSKQIVDALKKDKFL